MPTLAGLRRRGVPPAAIRDFVKRIGVAKANSVVDIGLFEFSVREILNKTRAAAHGRAAAAEGGDRELSGGQTEELDAVNNPDDPGAGSRKIRFGREIFVEQDDFMENPPKKFYRLSPGKEVRLRYAYFITCREVVKNAAGEVVELRCTYDPATRGGNAPDGRKVQATHPLGVGGGCGAGRGAALQPAVRQARPGRRQLRRRPQLQLARGARQMRASSRRWQATTPASQCSSSGRVISAAIATAPRASSCSTAPSACATPGRRLPAAARADLFASSLGVAERGHMKEDDHG